MNYTFLMLPPLWCKSETLSCEDVYEPSGWDPVRHTVHSPYVLPCRLKVQLGQSFVELRTTLSLWTETTDPNIVPG